MMDRLAASYEACRVLHRAHGRTYYLATRLLPGWKRRHVHALYGFTRHADEIVDSLAAVPAGVRARRLAEFADAWRIGLSGGAVTDPLLPAVCHTIDRFGLDVADFDTFLACMAMDLHTPGYATYADLLDYMEGSAAVIGTMMLPILGSPDPGAAREPARQLGLAFQLTNFIRDVAEDLTRGRVYLPEADLARFGLTRTDLSTAAATGTSTPAIRELIAFEVQRARAHYAAAAPGITLLDDTSQGCIRAAYRLYAAICQRIAAADYDVMTHRHRVPRHHRLTTAIRALRTPPGTPEPTPGPTLDPHRWPTAATHLSTLGPVHTWHRRPADKPDRETDRQADRVDSAASAPRPGSEPPA